MAGGATEVGGIGAPSNVYGAEPDWHRVGEQGMAELQASWPEIEGTATSKKGSAKLAGQRTE